MEILKLEISIEVDIRVSLSNKIKNIISRTKTAATISISTTEIV